MNTQDLHKVFNAILSGNYQINKEKDAPLEKMIGGVFRFNHSTIMWAISDPLRLEYKRGGK